MVESNHSDITNYFNFKPRFSGFFSKQNLARIKYGAYVINLDDKNSKETHWVLLFIDKSTLILLELNIFLKKY